MAGPDELTPLPARASRLAFALALPATLLTVGCAALPSKTGIDPAALRDRSIDVVVKPPPSFYADNKDRRRFGIVGVLVMAHEGNRHVKQHNLVDPAIALGAALEKAIDRAEASARARAAAAASAASAATAASAAATTSTTAVRAAAASTGPSTLASTASLPAAITPVVYREGPHGDPPRSLRDPTGAAPRHRAGSKLPAPASTAAASSAAAASSTAAASSRTSAASTTSAASVASPTPIAPAAAAPAVASVEPGNPGASGSDLTLFVQTLNWEYRPFRGHDDQFYVIYSARVDLVDNRSGRLLARDRCEVTPTVDARLTEEELLADEARRLRLELAATSGLCLAMLRSQPIAGLLDLSPPLARR